MPRGLGMGDKKITRMATLAALIRERGWERGAELGLWQGATLGYLLGAFPDLRMIGVDNWAAVGPYEGKDMIGAEAMVRRIARAFPSRCVIKKASTVDAATTVQDGSLDFVFIDASHDTESVVADIRAWQPKLRHGGKLCGHDADWPEVMRALAQELVGYSVLGGNVWIAH